MQIKQRVHQLIKLRDQEGSWKTELTYTDSISPKIKPLYICYNYIYSLLNICHYIKEIQYGVVSLPHPKKKPSQITEQYQKGTIYNIS